MAPQSDILQTESITKLLRGQFPEESGDVVNVEDISGGCGAMFRVRVESTQFEGMPKVKQHKLINEVLKKEIKEMHGIVIETKTLEKK
uniref:BolA-like protein n=1 Tax=Meloidogyne incognita TaxID=6306 RepID=A0A914L5F8_MELIC